MSALRLNRFGWSISRPKTRHTMPKMRSARKRSTRDRPLITRRERIAKMPCDTRLKAKQTIQERAAEVRRAVTQLDKLIARGQVRVKVGPQGAVAFSAWADN